MKHLKKFESFDTKINEEVITLFTAALGAASLFTALVALYNRGRNDQNNPEVDEKIEHIKNKLKRKGLETDAKKWIDANLVSDSEFNSKLRELKTKMSGQNVDSKKLYRLNNLIKDLKNSMDHKLEPLMKTRPELYLVIRDELEKI